ncbi:methylenetetrahydrofolate reductase [NAD(P)H] [Nocardioides perillae]|uniref:Methylenetetrahydrofolate reductase n=1 Tax=Nocardioides perillae TaxID=1119534 RepID=A0A7Y9UVB0_9ACTN|nr:methylenetetrahydrofolate reductase [NAD(P)H] [Nocardioides perillae]NYG56250.1 methylenetetrahydrofolate reductase (NADPH) [Nocardioides perillae]
MPAEPLRPVPDEATGPDSHRIGDVVRTGERVISFEFMPPRDEAGAAQLWSAIRDLEPYEPTFVSVTYGAGGTTRDTTVEITGRIARETALRAMGHLTCVGHTRQELVDVITAYRDAGVHNILALRGDPQDGPSAPWTPTEGGLSHAVELVELCHEVGDFSVGVAAFPEKHPGSESLEHDAQVLAAKARAGADFAVTQLFFRASDYAELVDRAAAAGCDIPVLPGIMPITNLRQVTRMAELSGAEVPASLLARFEGLTDPADVRREGVRIATELCEELLAAGAPGLHFFTLNRSRATLEIFEALRITV